MIGKTVQELQKGETAQFSKTVSEADIYLFAGITSDFNPAHVDEEYARKTFFATRIAHGLLSAGFISAVIANKLPGPDTIYMRQELDFLGVVKIGDTIKGPSEAPYDLRQPGGQAGADRRSAGQPAAAA
ncbi:MAG: MaoC family dehydratase [Desulfobacterales bacterium]|nr:MaoC family dehydratase [Desulfobacterales bacterium]